jgi:hypothetical protein
MSAPTHAVPNRDLLVPVLDLSSGPPDPVAITTWHMALSNLVAPEIPHQLLGLWIFPERGGPVLLGPDGLAQDSIPLPEPAPTLTQDQLFDLEEVLRRAKYASATAVAIRAATRDVGLMVFGTFEAGAYGPGAARAMARLGEMLAGPLEALAGLLVGDPATEPHRDEEASFASVIAELANQAPSGSELVRRLSGLLHPQVPHDRLEILIFANGQRTALPLSGLSGRRRWGTGSSTWSDLARLFDEILGTDPSGSIPNLATEAPGLTWPGSGSGTSTGPVRIGSVGVARLTLGGEQIGLLVVGHAGQGLYRPVDESVLSEAAAVIAGRVLAFRLETESQSLRGQLEVLQSPSLPVLRAAEALAGTAHLGEALHRFDREVNELVPHRTIAFLLRVTETEVVEFGPDTLRPLADLAPIAIEASAAKSVLQDGRPWTVDQGTEQDTLTVALKVADRVIGAMVLTTGRLESPRDAAAMAHQFASILAPHLELLRRATGSRATAPAFKRS